jgi:hypothetical protein
VVWKVDDEQTDILLATLNRLGGRDTLEKKLALLQRLSVTIATRKLATLLPQTRGQLERLVSAGPPAQARPPKSRVFTIPMVFFVDETQKQAIEKAISHVAAGLPDGQTRAARRARALTYLAQYLLHPDERGALERDAATASTAAPNP